MQNTDEKVDFNSPHLLLAKKFLQFRLQQIEEACLKLAIDDRLGKEEKLSAKWLKALYVPAVQALMTCDQEEIAAALNHAIKAVAILTAWIPPDTISQVELVGSVERARDQFNQLLGRKKP